MRLPFKTKDTEKKVRLLSAPDTVFPLIFISKGFVTPAEKDFVTEVQSTKGTRSLEVGKKIQMIAEKVAPHNGGNPNAVAKALIQYRDKRGTNRPQNIDAGQEWSPYPLFEEYSGYFGMYAQGEVDAFQLFLREHADLWDSSAMATVSMRRALKNDELEYDAKKWKIEQAQELEDFFLVQLQNFYYLELNELTHYHLKPIEGTDEYELRYDTKNYIVEQKKQESTEEELEGKEDALEVAAGKS
ncbi:MAG: hypothetical protein ACRC62_08715 [Microcoleus sp.]